MQRLEGPCRRDNRAHWVNPLMKGPVKQVTGAVAALIIGGITYLVVPDRWSLRARTFATLAVAAAFWLLLLLLANLVPRVRKAMRRLADGIALKLVQIFVLAVKRWAEQNKDVTGKDTTWNWLTDQLLVAQGRYAFSVSCIAFDPRGSELKC